MLLFSLVSFSSQYAVAALTHVSWSLSVSSCYIPGVEFFNFSLRGFSMQLLQFQALVLISFARDILFSISSLKLTSFVAHLSMIESDLVEIKKLKGSLILNLPALVLL